MTSHVSPMCGVFTNPVMRSLALSDVFAFLGVWLTSLTLLTGVYEVTHSSLAQGLVIAAQFGPALLVVPIAGHILDRFNPAAFLIGLPGDLCCDRNPALCIRHRHADRCGVDPLCCLQLGVFTVGYGNRCFCCRLPFPARIWRVPTSCCVSFPIS